MKKILALVLACIMVFALCACAKTAEPEESKTPAAEETKAETSAEEAKTDAPVEKTKLKVMIWGSIDGRDEREKEWLAMNPEFAEKYEIEYILGGQSDKDCMEKIRLALASGENLCDIIILNYTQVPELARAGALMDIGDYYKPYEDQITEAGKQLSQYDGKYIAVPSEIKTRIWFYRQDIFDECGVDVNTIKTTDDFIAAGKKIQETYPDAMMFNLGAQAQGYDFYLTLSGNGATYFDADGNYTIGSDPGVKACLEDYKKMVDAGIVADLSDWTPDWEAALADGTIVSVPSAAWMGNKTFLPTYSADNVGKWACTTWPAIGGSTGGSDAGGQIWAVPAFSSNPEAAAEYICWKWLSEEAELKTFEIFGTITGMSNKSALANEMILNTPNEFFGTSLVEAQIAAADQFGIFNYSPNATAEQTIALEYFIKAAYGEMGIDEAMQAAEKDMKDQIGNAFN